MSGRSPSRQGRWRRLAALPALAAVLAGCGLGPGSTPKNVTLTVTNDFGAHVVQEAGTPSLSGSETVMQLLQRNDRITTRYGGGFVESIGGLSGNDTSGQPIDWFYYVNGVEAAVGAAATNLHAGDRVWWDRHDWSVTDDVPAVVGSFPEPFVNGIGGKRYPVTIYCAVPSGAACHTVGNRLAAFGVTVTFGALGTDEPDTLRVLVGTYAQLRVDPAAVYLEEGTQTSGVYAHIPADGASIALLDPQGRVVRTLGAGSGLVAADVIPHEVPTWLVIGTNAAGVGAAANAFDAATLRNRFAVAVAPGGTVIPIPVTGA